MKHVIGAQPSRTAMTLPQAAECWEDEFPLPSGKSFYIQTCMDEQQDPPIIFVGSVGLRKSLYG